jgi:hypothetical protein
MDKIPKSLFASMDDDQIEKYVIEKIEKRKSKIEKVQEHDEEDNMCCDVVRYDEGDEEDECDSGNDDDDEGSE